MKPPIALVLVVGASGCLAPQSSFAFVLSGDVAEHIHSEAQAPGEVDNAGYLAIDDQAWGLKVSLGGLAPGSRIVAKSGGGELVIMSKVSGDVFGTSQGGQCTVWIDPHESTNGSAVTGWFTCTGLASSDGKVVDVQGGRFGTFINDTANDPKETPPTPGA